MTRILLTAVVALALAVPAAPAQDKPAKSALLQPGALEKLRPHLERIFAFGLDGPRIKLDRKRWGEPLKNPPMNVANIGGAGSPPIEQIFNQIRTIAGFGGTSMSVGPNYRELRFTGNMMNGRVMTRGDVVRFDIEEIAAPARSIEYADDANGGWRLLVNQADGDLILLQQNKAGTFTVASVLAGKPFAAQGPSFLAVYKQHRAALEADVLPVLNALAVQLFVPPSSQELRSAVRSMLLRSPQLLEDGTKLLADLDSEVFVVRDRASKVLNDRFEMYKDLIDAKLKDAALSVETERRLHKILANHPDSQKVAQVIAALELLSDAEFLVGLLEETPAADRGPIGARLEQVTQQRHGQDVAAWKQWLAARGKK